MRRIYELLIEAAELRRRGDVAAADYLENLAVVAMRAALAERGEVRR
jgi:hypothetical protein